MKETPWSRIRGQNSVNNELQETAGSGKATGSVLKETIAVSVTISTSVQKQHSRILLRALLRGRMREMYREPEVPEAKSPSGRMSRLPCKDYLKGTCTNSFCEKWHLPVCLFYKSENGCRFGEKCSFAHRQFEEQPSERSKKNGDKSAVAMLKITRQLGCVFQGMEPPNAVLLQSGLNENWWADSIECCTYLRNVTDLLSDGKTPYERRFGQPFKGPIIPFGSLAAKDLLRIHQFGKKVLPGLLLGYALYAGGTWKGDILVADLEELETMDASEICSKRLNAKEVIFPKENGNFIFQSQMDESNFPEEIRT